MKILETKDITKSFPGVLALNSVNISFEEGKIHCIVGENGAGKSTLIKCLTGVYEPDSGDILLGGKSVFEDKKLFDRVAYVPQEIDLFNYMTVAENLFIPFERTGIKGIISQKEIQKKAIPILEKFHISAAPDALIRNIPVSQQQLLQVARATAFEDYDVLMLDEPTTSLTTKDTEYLFTIIRRLRDENKAVIFISHKLEEVLEVGDEVTVLRNGEMIDSKMLADVDIPWIVNQMTGQVIDEKEVFYSEKVTDEVLLEVNHLTGERFTDISFTLKKGEILGFSGLVGAGRSELMQAIFGFLPVYSGSVKFEGKEWKFGDTCYSVDHRFFYLPEDRKRQGILSMLSVRENISINSLKQLLSGMGVNKKKEVELVNRVVAAYDVRTPTIEKEIKYLSGGNQQKAIIGRSMTCNPSVLVFDEPTKGIDVGTKVDIYRLIKRLAEDGIGIILISSELNEVKKCSNRIISLYDGKIAGEHNQNADKEEILSAMFGLNKEKTEVI